MAVIGHAEIIITPITRGFEASVKRDLKSIKGTLAAQGSQAGQGLAESFSQGFSRSLSNNMFGKLSDGLRNMVPEAEAAREKFQSLVRTGYVLQGIIGPLIGGLSSLVVSLGTLIGVLGRAAPAVGILASAFTTLRVAMAAAKWGFGDIFGAVKRATEPNKALGKSLAEIREEFQQLQFQAEEASLSEERAALNLEKALVNLQRTADLPPNSAARREAKLAYEEAELAYRRAKDRTQDLNAEVAKGPQALNDAAAGNDPFAGLNEAQREFAEYLVSLQPKFDELELKLSQALLPPLRDAVDILMDELYPILDRELPKIAGEVGETLKQTIDDIDWGVVEEILQGMTEPFGDNQLSNIELFGQLIGNILDIFLQISNGAAPLLNDFLTWIVDKTGTWGDNMRAMDLEKFFNDAGEVAGDLGEIIGNIFLGLGNLIGLTTGPDSAGSDMLEWMKNGTAEFANMFSEDPEAGKQFFRDAFANAKDVMGSIGALLNEILKLADNPNIGKTFKTLEEGAPDIGEMLGKMIDAGPSFAEFVVTLTKLANAFTDSEQISAFFDTLNIGAEKFLEFVETDGFKKLLEQLGPIFASLSAVGVMLDVAQFGFNVLVGYIAYALGLFDNLLGGAKKVFGFLKLPIGGGWIGIIIAAIIFLITKAVEFYNKFTDFKVMVDKVGSEIAEAFGGFKDSIMGFFDTIFGQEGAGGIVSALDPIIKFFLEFLIPMVGSAITRVLESLTSIVDFITSVVGSVFDSVGLVIEGILNLFSGDFKGGMIKILSGAVLIILGVIQAIVNGVISIINIAFIDSINGIIRAVANSPLGSFLKDTLGIDLSNAQFGKIELVDWTGDARRRIDNYLLSEKTAGTSMSGSITSSISNSPTAMALGGVVYPRSGGTIVQVAEAGRPERIEPLNPNGLSDRDIAIMQQMGVGGGINITVNPSPGMDERELARLVGNRVAYEIGKGH